MADTEVFDFFGVPVRRPVRFSDLTREEGLTDAFLSLRLETGLRLAEGEREGLRDGGANLVVFRTCFEFDRPPFLGDLALELGHDALPFFETETVGFGRTFVLTLPA